MRSGDAIQKPLAAKVEAKLVYAAIQAGVSKDDMKQLAARLGSTKELKVLGPVERAELIRLLADRNRKPAEIEQMAAPIGMLKTIHSVPLPWLVESFDRLLRLTNEPADKSAEQADVLHATGQNAAASFEEIVDSLLLFYDGEDALSDQVENEKVGSD